MLIYLLDGTLPWKDLDLSGEEKRTAVIERKREPMIWNELMNYNNVLLIF